MPPLLASGRVNNQSDERRRMVRVCKQHACGYLKVIELVLEDARLHANSTHSFIIRNPSRQQSKSFVSTLSADEMNVSMSMLSEKPRVGIGWFYSNRTCVHKMRGKYKEGSSTIKKRV
eukprot:1191242-Prorocentrum_minimum.AAC.1